MSEQETPAAEKPQRRIVGRVVSDKMDKTVTVLVERRVRHPMYGKYVKKSTKLHVHDENNEAHEGDTIAVVETRPISRSKRFRLVEIVERASKVQVAAAAAAAEQAS